MAAFSTHVAPTRTHWASHILKELSRKPTEVRALLSKSHLTPGWQSSQPIFRGRDGGGKGLWLFSKEKRTEADAWKGQVSSRG